MKYDLRGIKTDDSFSFSRYTTYGLGGGAKAAFFPRTKEEAVTVYDFVKENYNCYVVLGNGSDVLAADGGFDGAVICTKLLSGITRNGNRLNCLGGTTVKTLLSYCVNNGLSGLEYLAGIPASVGGLAYMNGGVNSKHIGEDITEVGFYDGELRIFNRERCNFSNKHSTMRDINCIIVQVSVNITQSDPKTVKQNIDEFLQMRKAQPKGKSCGCVFKNPSGLNVGAGKLIDGAGLKGLRMGGAEVSREHANFIINHGGSSADVRGLIKAVKARVKEFYGVDLEEEVVYIGEFYDSDS